jgi:hypothetical protein
MAVYQLDLSRLSLDWLRTMLAATRLLPSEAILAERTDERLTVLRDAGFDSLAELVSSLATPKKVDALAQRLGIPSRFLTVLRRKVGAYQRKPVRLAEWSSVPPSVARSLAAVGLDDSRQVFDRVHGAGRDPSATVRELAEETGVDVEVLSRVVGLCDLLRGPYVGPAFAELMWQAGFRQLGEVCRLPPDVVHDRLVAANAASRGYGQAVPRGEDLRSWCVMVEAVVDGTT